MHGGGAVVSWETMMTGMNVQDRPVRWWQPWGEAAPQTAAAASQATGGNYKITTNSKCTERERERENLSQLAQKTHIVPIKSKKQKQPSDSSKTEILKLVFSSECEISEPLLYSDSLFSCCSSAPAVATGSRWSDPLTMLSISSDEASFSTWLTCVTSSKRFGYLCSCHISGFFTFFLERDFLKL